MLMAGGFSHHIQDSTTMKTLIVLCSLVAITIGVPTLPRGNFDNLQSTIEDLSERNIREKKSPLHDSPQDAIFNDGKEISQNRHSHKTETSSLEKSKGFRKPIIIKKKLGYHIYRDSDEEMAHADPNENCRKQFKVKLCDNEPSIQSHSNNIKTLISERPHEMISDKHMENSIKMARDAVENLQRDILKMEQNTAKMSNAKENFESDMTLQQDIEMAKSALEHIQKNIADFETTDLHLHDQKREESKMPKSSDAEKIAKWKESIANIYKNEEMPRNIEDAFKYENQKLIKSESFNVPKMSENEILLDHLKDQSSTPSMKAVNDNNNLKLHSKDEQSINAENDMFVSNTNHDESKIKLHSESLTSANVFDKSLNGHDTKISNFNTDEHLMATKSSAKNSDLENEKKIHNLMEKPEEKAVSGKDVSSWQQNDQTNLKPTISVENNVFDTLTQNSDINSLALTAKNNENTESTTNDSHIESMSNDQCDEEQHTHKPRVKTIEGNNDKKEKFLETKSLSSEHEKDSIKSEGDITGAKQTLNESFDVVGTETKHFEHLNTKLADKDNKISSEEKITDHRFRNMLDKVDLNEIFNARTHQDQIENTQQSLLGDKQKTERISNEFTRMRIPGNQMHNHETQDYTLMQKDQMLQASKSVSHLQNTQSPTTNIEEHLNRNNNFNKSPFINEMNFAEEKHLNDNLPHLKTFSESNNEHSINLLSKTNEFRDQHMPHEYMKTRMHQNQHDEQQLRENHRLNDFVSMPSATMKQHIDHPSQQFKSEHFNEPFLQRWAQERQHKDLQEYKVNSENHNGHKSPTAMKTTVFSNGLQDGRTHKDPINMRIPDDSNLGHLFTDSHELHDSHLLHWAKEKQQNDNLAQTFDGATELYTEPHLNEHLHELIPTNRFHNNFDFDSSHNVLPMRPKMHEHMHMLKHAKSFDMDSAMQPSMQIGMRDRDINLGHHHHHHGLARSSYSPSLHNAGSSPGAVGVFSEANTSCGIPLLLSCSPSVVSGSLAKAQPAAMSAPAYRAGDDFMYYMKRDANNIEGLKNVIVHKTPKTFNH